MCEQKNWIPTTPIGYLHATCNRIIVSDRIASHTSYRPTSCTHIPIPESLPDSSFPFVKALALFKHIRALTMPEARYGLILDDELPSQLFRDDA